MRKFIGAILFLFCMFADNAGAQVNKQYFVWVGRDMVMDSRYREAIETLNILLRADPDAYEGYFWRGIAKYHLDDLLGAEADFSTAIRLNPVYTQAYTYRAITRSRLGNYDDALQDFREAIDLRPDLPGPYYSRGVTRLLNQQFKEAIDDFDKFIRQENKVADAFICRGLSYLHLKDTVRAYDNFNTAIRTNRENPRRVQPPRWALHGTETLLRKPKLTSTRPSNAIRPTCFRISTAHWSTRTPTVRCWPSRISTR